MKDYDFFEWKEEQLSALDHSVTDIVVVMNTVEELRAKAKLAKERRNEFEESSILIRLSTFLHGELITLLRLLIICTTNNLTKLFGMGQRNFCENKIMNMRI